MFDGQDPGYDIMIGLVLVGVPMALQFFYYRANKHIASKQRQKDLEDKGERDKLTGELKEFTLRTIAEVKRERERADREMLDTLKEVNSRIGKDIADMREYVNRQIKYENSAIASKLSSKIEYIISRQGEYNTLLTSRLDITEEMIDVVKHNIYELQNDIDEIYDKLAGESLSPSQKRERALKKKKRIDEIETKRRKISNLNRAQQNMKGLYDKQADGNLLGNNDENDNYNDNSNGDESGKSGR